MKLTPEQIIYPSSDGQPMADSTIQYQWITPIKGGCDALFKDIENVFVAGDLFWYPVEGNPNICQAPDVMGPYRHYHPAIVQGHAGGSWPSAGGDCRQLGCGQVPVRR